MSKPIRGRRLGLERVRVAVNTGRETLVQQQFKEETDINTIIRRFGLGEAPTYAQGVYGDFTGISDYYTAREAIERAEAGFMKLPAEARDKFNNDPGRFLEYAERVTPDELAEYCGLRRIPVVPDPAAVVVPPVAPAGS